MDIMGAESYEPLTKEQIKGLNYAISLLRDNEQTAIKLRYKEHMTLAECSNKKG